MERHAEENIPFVCETLQLLCASALISDFRHTLWSVSCTLKAKWTEGQRPASIPAWGNAPGSEGKGPRAESAIHARRRQRWDGLSALGFFNVSGPGRCPGLVCCRAFGPQHRTLAKCMTRSKCALSKTARPSPPAAHRFPAPSRFPPCPRDGCARRSRISAAAPACARRSRRGSRRACSPRCAAS